jgi:hypothetical protein
MGNYDQDQLSVLEELIRLMLSLRWGKDIFGSRQKRVFIILLFHFRLC